MALLAACQQLPVQGPGPTGVDAPGKTPPPAAAPASAPLLWDAVSPQEPGSTGLAQAMPVVPPPPADLWSRLRRGMQLAEPGGAARVLTDQHERWYRSHAAHMTRTFTRARLYLFDIVEAVERQGMPLEIALLPAVESAFMPEARSQAAAEGLWQFIAPTARRFDLKLHLFQDDRRAVRAATQAALRYLDELQRRYAGDYLLALAAYNCGEGCIDQAVQRARARGLPGRFEDLKLNPETAAYVPRLLGLVRVVAQAVDSGDLASAGLPAMANAAYFVAVPIQRDIDVARAAELAGLSLTEFRALNPQHKRPVIVAAATAEVLVPVEREARFVEAMLNYRGPLASWGAATVPRRTSVDALAQRHGIEPQALREANQIPPGHLVGAGSTVVVPRAETAPDITASQAQAATLATVPAMVRRAVQVLRKDTWASLSARLGVTPLQLRGWNPLLRSLRRGRNELTLPVTVAERLAEAPPTGAATSAAPRRGHPSQRPRHHPRGAHP